MPPTLCVLFFFSTDFRERENGREREREKHQFVPLIHASIGCFFLCALPRNQTHNLGIAG